MSHLAPAVASPPDDESEWEPPAKVGGFSIVGPLGHGGMGRVYLAREVDLDRSVALKFMSREGASEGAVRRFFTEARALARLSHPNVVDLYRIDETDGHYFIAYEFVRGRSLAQILKPVGWEAALRIAAMSARGLAAAHGAGILHRDLKPANVMLSDAGVVKLIDFGLAKVDMRLAFQERHDLAHPGALGRGAEGASVTRGVVGTLRYLPPEQWLGQTATPQGDIYSFGLVVHELLVGRVPHSSLTGEDLARAVLGTEAPSVGKLVPDVPRSFVEIVDRCVRRDPSQRFPTATDLVRQLDHVERVFLQPSSSVLPTQLDADALLVAASWSRISPRQGELSALLYDILFSERPDLRLLFPNDVTEQQGKLMHALELSIAGLGDPESLLPALRELGRRHVGYGVRTADLDALGGILLRAIAAVDTEANHATMRAWKRAYSFLDNAMRAGMNEDGHTDEEAHLVSPVAPILPSARGRPRTRYARIGEASVAYQSVGEGPLSMVVLPGLVTHLDVLWDNPSFAVLVRGLTGFAHTILFDRRGCGLSDRPALVTYEDLVADLLAVVDAASVRRAILFGSGEAAGACVRFAVEHPSRTQALVLFAAEARSLTAPDYPYGHPPAFYEELERAVSERWGGPIAVGEQAPSAKDDPVFRDWLAGLYRAALSPRDAIATLRLVAQTDVRASLPLVHAPTLVLHRSGDRLTPPAAGRWIAERIPHAEFVELPGADHQLFVGDVRVIVHEIERFVASLAETMRAP